MISPLPTADNGNTLSEAERPVLVCSTNEGWTKSLALLPDFSCMNLDNKLINSPAAIPNSGTAAKVFGNKKQGYKLWKEGFVHHVLVKPDIKLHGNYLL